MRLLINTIALLAMCLLTQCKDFDAPVLPDKNSHRLKTITKLNNDIELYHCELLYEKGKLIRTLWTNSFNDIYINEENNDFEYLGNTVTIISSQWQNHNWEKKCAYKYILEDNKVTEYQQIDYCDNSWFTSAKYIYSYEDNRLIESTYQEMKGNDIKDITKQEIIYANDTLEEIRVYEKDASDKWIWNQKEIFNYNRDDITEISVYVKNDETEWEVKERINMIFNNQRITEIYIFKQLPNSILWHLANSRIYLYDPNAYLYKIIENEGYETVYTYEDGHGNANLFYNTPIMYTIGYPTLKAASFANPFHPEIYGLNFR